MLRSTSLPLVSLAVLAALAGCAASTDKGTPGVLGGDTGVAEGGEDESGFQPDSADLGDVDLDGGLDPEKDNDGDGYLFKDDCNDGNKEVNPGAYEVPGDGVDNDCNGKTDEVDDCDTSTDLNLYKSTIPNDFAKALGLCRTAKAGTEGKDKTWGVIDAKLVRADGSAIDAASQVQFGILRNFGPTVKPRAGKNMVVISSGTARTPDYPGQVMPRSPSYSSLSAVAFPAGHPLKSDCGSGGFGAATANDSVNLKLKIRVPTNANAFSFDFDFFSSEYITFVCSSYNDSFVALLDTAVKLDPKFAKNVSFDSKGNPVSVNNGFFEVCTPGTSFTGGKTFPCSKGTKELEGTGFWDTDPKQNGSTSWLQTKAPVKPGEEITLQFMIWDAGDHILDSTVLIDNFKWDAKPTTGPVTDRPK
ncbi:MAG: putative metal-binding motif-containing protein [Myxococcales bacterium]|nr:putative metal-binding motif-containing protein [Myxococcales bacterium]